MRLFFGLGALFAGLAVIFGAFGAHALKATMSADDLATFEIGVRYQLAHALALFVVAWATTLWQSQAVTAAGWAFTIGIVVFSGSLYLLVLTDTRWLGAITPDRRCGVHRGVGSPSVGRTPLVTGSRMTGRT